MKGRSRSTRVVALSPLLLGITLACAGNPRAERRVTSDHRNRDVGCLDSLHANDSLDRILKLTVLSRDSGVRLPAEFQDIFAQEFRSRFSLPSKLALAIVTGVPPCDSLGSRCSAGMLDIGTFAYATAHNDGRLSDIAVIDTDLSPSLADTVASVLKRISNDSLGPPTGEVDSIPLVIHLESDEQSDSVSIYRTIRRLRIPRYDLPFRYASMPAAGVSAKYPFTARLAGVGDSVTVGFTVDAEGFIPASSVMLFKASYRDFVVAVADALLDTRYHPARLGDCAVATRMEQRFLFKLPN